MKMTALWDMAPFILVEIQLRFEGEYCFHHQGVREAVCTSETSACYYKVTRRHISDTCHLQVQIHLRYVVSLWWMKIVLTPSTFLLVGNRNLEAAAMRSQDRLHSRPLMYEVRAAAGDLRRFVGLVIVR
jgi:hypothetical protein